MRLDRFLVDQLKVKSRSQALHLIHTGKVFLNQVAILKPAYNVKSDERALIRIKEKNRYVGFGAYKLLKALKDFEISLKNRVILDIGASSGGFTQVCLEKGADFVYALDVGTNQLDERLRVDTRVGVLENLNIKDTTSNYFKEGITPSFFVTDVSFIPLSFVFESIAALDIPEGIVLIKPQFEVGDLIPNFDGVVKDPTYHQLAIDKVKNDAKKFGFIIEKITESPTSHSKKNQEFLGYVKKS